MVVGNALVHMPYPHTDILEYLFVDSRFKSSCPLDELYCEMVEILQILKFRFLYLNPMLTGILQGNFLILSPTLKLIPAFLQCCCSDHRQ